MSDLKRFFKPHAGGVILLLCVIAGVFYRLIFCQRRDLAEPPTPQIGLSSATTDASPREAGLSKSAIDALPTFADGGGRIEDPCAVCLNPVTKGEVMRLLPRCSHAFHVECIDTWLRLRSLCPLCRAEVSQPAAAAPAERMEV